MNKKKVHLHITTPEGVKVSQDADMVIMRSIKGDIGILPGHAPLSLILDDGILRIIEGKNEHRIALFGGIAKVEDNKISIISSSAKRPEEIDLEMAEKNRLQALKELQEKTDDLTIKSNQILLRRALVQIEVSSSRIIKKSKEEELVEKNL